MQHEDENDLIGNAAPEQAQPVGDIPVFEPEPFQANNDNASPFQNHDFGENLPLLPSLDVVPQDNIDNQPARLIPNVNTNFQIIGSFIPSNSMLGLQSGPSTVNRNFIFQMSSPLSQLEIQASDLCREIKALLKKGIEEVYDSKRGYIKEEFTEKDHQTLIKLLSTITPEIEKHMGSPPFFSIGAVGCTRLCAALKDNTVLTTLNLSEGNILDEGALRVAELLSKNSTIIELDLPDNNLSSVGIKHIAKVLEKNQSVTRINFNTNIIDCEGGGMTALGEAVRHNHCLVELTFDNAGGGSEGIVNFAQGLRDNISIRILDFRYCAVDDVGAIALGSALEGNTSLTELCLEQTDIDNDGLVALARALTVNKTLKKLNLSENIFDEEGLVGLASALEINSTLSELNLSRSSINLNVAIALGRALAINSGLTSICFGYCSLGFEEIQPIADSLRTNNRLEELQLYGNEQLSNFQSAKMITSALCENRTLRSLWISLSSEGHFDVTQKFSSMLAFNNTLCTLHIMSRQHQVSPPGLQQQLNRNKAYFFKRPACLFFARATKEEGIKNTFSILPLDVMKLIFSLCSVLYTPNNLDHLISSIDDFITRKRQDGKSLTF